MFHGAYSGRRVLLTGHTGFKGAYLALFLRELGAEVLGVALEPEGEPNLFRMLKLPVDSVFADIRDRDKMSRIFAEFRPEAVFHLAAQALVRPSFDDPAYTFDVNVMGTVNILDCCRRSPDVRAMVAVSSDKCYENRERRRGYVEDDPMGGRDPYSASKGCMELALSSYRRSFFPPEKYGKTHSFLLASGRAGNVIGGGDYAADRLVPDLMRAASEGGTAELRSPDSVRPWQHVFEPLSGYLTLGERLLAGDAGCSGGWNFGPGEEQFITVREAAEELAKHWERIRFRCADPAAAEAKPEARLLAIDCGKAARELCWRPVWTASEAFERTACYYRDLHDGADGGELARNDLQAYLETAEKEGLAWTK